MRGMVNPDTVFSDERADSDGSMAQRSGANKIVITKPSNNPGGRLALDIVTYDLSNCGDISVSTRSQSLIVRDLIRSDIKPTSVEYTVEYTRDDSPDDGEISYDEDIGISVGI